jgi:hypothetical protein
MNFPEKQLVPYTKQTKPNVEYINKYKKEMEKKNICKYLEQKIKDNYEKHLYIYLLYCTTQEELLVSNKHFYPIQLNMIEKMNNMKVIVRIIIYRKGNITLEITKPYTNCNYLMCSLNKKSNVYCDFILAFIKLDKISIKSE